MSKVEIEAAFTRWIATPAEASGWTEPKGRNYNYLSRHEVVAVLTPRAEELENNSTPRVHPGHLTNAVAIAKLEFAKKKLDGYMLTRTFSDGSKERRPVGEYHRIGAAIENVHTDEVDGILGFEEEDAMTDPNHYRNAEIPQRLKR